MKQEQNEFPEIVLKGKSGILKVNGEAVARVFSVDMQTPVLQTFGEQVHSGEVTVILRGLDISKSGKRSKVRGNRR